MSHDLDVKKVYNGYDNLIEYILTEDSVAYDLVNVTEVHLIMDGLQNVQDSFSGAFPIKWSGLSSTGQIQLQLGGQTFTVGKYLAKLVIFEPGYTNGQVWAEIPIEVV